MHAHWCNASSKCLVFAHRAHTSSPQCGPLQYSSRGRPECLGHEGTSCTILLGVDVGMASRAVCKVCRRDVISELTGSGTPRGKEARQVQHSECLFWGV
jgi:hypothetical protein